MKTQFSIPTMLICCFLTLQCSQTRNSAQTTAPAAAEKDSQLAKLQFSDLNGSPMKLEDFAGKPVFLNFWATWCGPCVSEMKSIEAASKQFEGKITFLALSSESTKTIQNYLKNNPFTFKFAHLDVSYLDVYVAALPTTWLINADGKIVATERGFRNWSDRSSVAQLQELLSK